MKNNNRKKKLTAIDLFCGAGGLSVGLKKAGFKVLAGVELDDGAADSYQMNHKNHILYREDIRNINPEKILSDLNIKPGQLDLLAGCPPCQGFSSHRTRNKVISVKDYRNDLIYEFLRFVDIMKPKAVMVENVPGLIKDKRISNVKKRLIEIGYIIGENTISIKDACDYGVPQRRKRMILQASRFGIIESPKTIEKKKTVYDAIGSLQKPGNTDDELHDIPENRTERIKELIKLIPKNGGSRKDLPKKYWLPCHLRHPNAYTDVYGRMCWDTVAPTITGGCVDPSKGRFLHPTQNRAITLREAALLQTFPPQYRFALSKGKQAVALMIGNALPPIFIQQHANLVKKHLEIINSF